MLIVIVLIFYIFYHVTIVMVIPHTLAKMQILDIEWIITSLHVSTEHPPTNLTTMFLNVVIRTIMLLRNVILKFMLL